MSSIRLLLALVCTHVALGYSTTSPVAPAELEAPSPASPQVKRVIPQLVEVRVRPEGGPWAPPYWSDDKKEFPGLHAPLEIIRAALACEVELAITGTDDFKIKLRERFERHSFAAGRTMSLAKGPPTCANGQWEVRPCRDLCYAFEVVDDAGQPVITPYTQQEDGRQGTAAYWLLFRPVEIPQ